MNILIFYAIFGLTEQWRSIAVSGSEILTSLIGTFNYMDFTIKTTGRLQLPLTTDDSPEESHEALTRYKDPSQDVYPQNVTRKNNTFSL